MHLKDHPLYKTLKNIKKRCRDEINYKDRGITVCERWQSSTNFIADMEPSWFIGATIERIDNAGPYSPENCRWATWWEQNRNKRVNVWLDYQGERLCLADVARRVGLHKRTLGWRLRQGLTPPALFAPANPQPPKNSVRIDTEIGLMPTSDATLLYGVSREMLYLRRKQGKTWATGLLDLPDPKFRRKDPAPRRKRRGRVSLALLGGILGVAPAFRLEVGSLPVDPRASQRRKAGFIHQ